MIVAQRVRLPAVPRAVLERPSGTNSTVLVQSRTRNGATTVRGAALGSSRWLITAATRHVGPRRTVNPLGAAPDSKLIPNAPAQPETTPLPGAREIRKTPGQAGYRTTRRHRSVPAPSGSQARNGGSIPLTRSLHTRTQVRGGFRPPGPLRCRPDCSQIARKRCSCDLLLARVVVLVVGVLVGAEHHLHEPLAASGCRPGMMWA